MCVSAVNIYIEGERDFVSVCDWFVSECSVG